MKTTAKSNCPAFLAVAFTFAPLCLALAAEPSNDPVAADVSNSVSTPAPVITAAPAPSPQKLPYGVEDVLKLSRAQVGENVILNFVQSSGTIYNLEPKDIVYLRDQGVSDKVINAMLDQRKRVEVAAQTAGPAPVVTQNPSPSQSPPPDSAAGPTAQVSSDPNVVAEAPLTPPASSVYVIPYSGAYSYYAPYGYYYPYYGWYGPSFSLGFRFGGHGYWGGRGYYGGHGFGGHAYGGHVYGGHGSFGGHGGHR
jgi:hypothetical protein